MPLKQSSLWIKRGGWLLKSRARALGWGKGHLAAGCSAPALQWRTHWIPPRRVLRGWHSLGWSTRTTHTLNTFNSACVPLLITLCTLYQVSCRQPSHAVPPWTHFQPPLRPDSHSLLCNSRKAPTIGPICGKVAVIVQNCKIAKIRGDWLNLR